MNSFDFSKVARFVGQYIRNDCFTELQDLHMWLADERPQGMNDPDVKALAYWLSQAVDYAKSGVKVDLYKDVINAPRFKVGRAKPDFLRGVNQETPDDTNKEYYLSSKLLGKIYRTISKIEYRIPDILDDTPLQEKVAHFWKEQFRNIDAELGDIAPLQEHIKETIDKWFRSEIHGEMYRYRYVPRSRFDCSRCPECRLYGFRYSGACLVRGMFR